MSTNKLKLRNIFGPFLLKDTYHDKHKHNGLNIPINCQSN